MNLGKLHVLIADDLSGARRILRDMLTSLGVGRVTEAESGREAMKRLRLTPPDILFTDWEMQPMDGIELIRMLRLAPDSPNPFLPIVLITAHSAEERVAAGRDAGATEVLAKPITPWSVVSRLTAIIERPRPFVKSATYFGPDRRRHHSADYPGPFRRRTDDAPDGSGDTVEL